MRVTIHLHTQSQPMVYVGVHNCYQKGDLYCIMFNDQRVIIKFPIQHIFRITEEEVATKQVAFCFIKNYNWRGSKVIFIVRELLIPKSKWYSLILKDLYTFLAKAKLPDFRHSNGSMQINIDF